MSEMSPVQLNTLFDANFDDRQEGQIYVEDRRFLTIMQEIRHRDDGHYELPLPFKHDVTLPNNRTLALKRLGGLKRKLITDQNYRTDYVTFMDNLLENGYAEKVPPDETPAHGSIWYIPHHAVYHAKKHKIRVVFDCSAEYKGESLNHHLLQGPDMINNLTGILCRFREERVAFMCDIGSMFHQVGVNVEHRNFLRFLWWDNPQLDMPSDYRMTVHLFGAKSSPSCVNFALKTTAIRFETEHVRAAADFIRDDFYVDDGLKSVSSQQEATQLITSSQDLCRKGGFRLHKIVANHKDVIEAIPLEDRAKDIQKLDLLSDDPLLERTL